MKHNATRPCGSSPYTNRYAGMERGLLLCILLTILGQSIVQAQAGQSERWLLETELFLGKAEPREWTEFQDRIPFDESWQTRFELEQVPDVACLWIRQRDVKMVWKVLLNDREIGTLEQSEEDLVHVIKVPQDSLRAGSNVLKIQAPDEQDDIEIGPIEWVPSDPNVLFDQSSLSVQIHDSQGRLTPSRLTIVNESNTLMPFKVESMDLAAVRTGVVYSGTGDIALRLRPGRYQVFASKGPAFDAPERSVELTEGEDRFIAFELHEDWETSGWVSVDPHVHTFTHSRHGDATVRERILTVAGEGLNVSIATDHNFHADYQQEVEAMGLSHHVLAVTGNEVTTSRGHFNAFPIVAESRVPNFRLTAWDAILDSIRSTPHVKTVILNHPRGLHGGFRPFAREHFNPVTGENTQGWTFQVNAMEIANSSAMRSDIMLTFRDWFALLNHGHRVFGVGSSDCHDVSRYIVGQGRTYVRVSNTAPDEIDIFEMCDAMNAGRMIVSMGLFIEATIDGIHSIGDLVTVGSNEPRLDVEVQSSNWALADRLEVFANGVRILDFPLSAVSETTQERLTFRLPRYAHDYHLILIASGPGVTRPHFKIPKPYQPDSPDWTPQILAATNPIWMDADSDGVFTAPRQYAERLVQSSNGSLKTLLLSLESYDISIAAQAASLMARSGVDLLSPQNREIIRQAASSVQEGFERFISTL